METLESHLQQSLQPEFLSKVSLGFLMGIIDKVLFQRQEYFPRVIHEQKLVSVLLLPLMLHEDSQNEERSF